MAEFPGNVLKASIAKMVGVAQAPQFVELGLQMYKLPGFETTKTPDDAYLALSLKRAHLSPRDLTAARIAFVDYYEKGLGATEKEISGGSSMGPVRFQRTEVIARTLSTILTANPASDVNYMLANLASTAGGTELFVLGSHLRSAEYEFALASPSTPMHYLLFSLSLLNKYPINKGDLAYASGTLEKFIFMRDYHYHSIILLKYWPASLNVVTAMGGAAENHRLTQMETAEFILVDQCLNQVSVFALKELGNLLPLEMSGVVGELRSVQENTAANLLGAQYVRERLQEYFRQAGDEDRKTIRDAVALLIVNGY